ncbi:putative HTH-type transcriptional regulator [BD1-7 clade bacterium]|uniref:Putative HTH-type transcriptional regulator n=1 Tax=BD1-7 clade bacterium TaxID=2029982 RepID=A0A5S9NKT1_9GAMM|nr:putative HTH-type transcriptional regulator [BD1-7 clade bacterium]CAA0093142.1 putative HTH-type transcriptional regulator [BD1-7 clade bacterium]CAA0121728.1 putative HTH-type transcriptional regulator [BD1-7 clade bacterium]
MYSPHAATSITDASSLSMAELKDAGTLIRLAYQSLKSLGINAEKVLEDADLDIDQLYNSKLRTPHWGQQVFWQAAETVSDDPLIGLKIGKRMPLFKSVVLEHLFISAQNYGEGLTRVLNYQRLISDAIDLTLHDDAGSDEVWLTFKYPNNDLRHLIDCSAMVLVQVMRTSSDGALLAKKIDICHDGADYREEYERLLGCPINFGTDENRIYFEKSALAARSLHNHPELLDFHTRCAEAQLEDLKRRDLINDVRHQIGAMLETGDLTSETIARALSMDAHDMVSRLREAGTSFSEILNDYRHHLSRKLLLATDEPISEIVYLTGFSEPSTFYRAFKRWEGVTPVEFRKRYAKAEEGPDQ